MEALTINRKKFGINIQEVYFSESNCTTTTCDLEVSFCMNAAGKNSTKALTSLINLAADESIILSRFRRNYRREINGFHKSTDFKFEFITDPTLEQISEFCVVYDEFSAEKGLGVCNQEKLIFFAEQKALVLSYIRSAASDDLLCQHAYICNDERTRLLYSVSNFRFFLENSAQRNQIGKAHRFLHWSDILNFKKIGYKIYDLGGLAKEQASDLQSINHFKEGFGGELHSEYVNFTPHTLKGRMAMYYLMKKL